MQLFATLATLALATIGSVTAVPSYVSKASSDSTSQCDTGSISCCNSLEPANSGKGKTIIDSLGIDVPTQSYLGLQCSPLDTSSVGGNPSCSANPVCCSGNTYGTLSAGCIPINVAL
ncbi:fungal hydrophobin [Lentinus tigrinus ALCF2SS1-7]|uniref:Hydrophobin n=1 Tax=Lentinus tigrinus ALCF2SS1-6 TaxID=1328759 RepID=A0A5C2S1Q0_9APHY|nr:fungal hydrophobin [Lentinus tigrinus ALCF2SS1-6]RPD71119.1 fungal hydrophobin [Lentinus tigrinus ALCF2SS1-7]